MTPSRPHHVVNLSGKFDVNIFISDRYVAIVLHRWFGCEMPIYAYFGEFFGFCNNTAKIKWKSLHIDAYIVRFKF